MGPTTFRLANVYGISRTQPILRAGPEHKRILFHIPELIGSEVSLNHLFHSLLTSLKVEQFWMLTMPTASAWNLATPL